MERSSDIATKVRTRRGRKATMLTIAHRPVPGTVRPSFSRTQRELDQSLPVDIKLCKLCILRSLNEERRKIKSDLQLLHIEIILTRLCLPQGTTHLGFSILQQDMLLADLPYGQPLNRRSFYDRS
jgi:hypothetical protein